MIIPLFKPLHFATLLAATASIALSTPQHAFAQAAPQLSSGIQLSNVIDSASGPAMTVLNNSIIVAYVDDNTKDLVVARAFNPDASDLSAGFNTGIAARDVPAVAVFNNMLYVVYDDSRTGQLYAITSPDGVTFSAPIFVNITGYSYIQPEDGIGLQAFNGALYLSFLASGNSGAPRQAFSAGSSDGFNYTSIVGPSITNQGFVANYGASLTLDSSGRLVITSTDTNGDLYQDSIAPNNGLRFKYTPAAINFNGVLYTFGRNWAENHNLEEGAYGPNGFTGYYLYPQRISTAPGATVFGSTLLVGARSDSNNHLVIFSATN